MPQQPQATGHGATLLERYEFNSKQITILRRWYRLRYGTTINDARQLAREFLTHAIKNQWFLVEVETTELSKKDLIPPA